MLRVIIITERQPTTFCVALYYVRLLLIVCNILQDSNNMQQNRQALLKAKYCPRVAALLCTQKTPRNPCDLDSGV